jgi:aspartate/methionine/tyrosine aminotransferase
VLAFQQLERLAARARALITPNVIALRSFLERTPGLEGFVEHGTVAFPRLASGADAETFAAKLMRDSHTAVVPGRFFEAPSHMRIGVGIAPDVLQRGLHNISAAL